MVEFLNRTYSGKVIRNDNDRLVLILNTADSIEDLAPLMPGITQINEIIEGGYETVYTVTAPISFRVVSNNVYSFEFSTKPTLQQETEARMQSLSDAVDDLLIMVLEG